MSYKDFLSLSFYDQLRALYVEGTFIVAIRYYKHKVNLYLMKGYYIEVFYNHKEDKIDKIDLYDSSSNRSKFYADQVKLPAGLL
ncbi:MAG: hypothetical protein RIC80_15260 [Cyclobacteriaceae bacterium]